MVVTGVPTKAYRLPTEWIQPNSTVVNVASFKNVDEEALLKIPGVVYVPMVGKVTVAMLERNLMRLYDQFHASNHPRSKDDLAVALAQQKESTTSLALQVYTAVVLTTLLYMQFTKK